MSVRIVQKTKFRSNSLVNQPDDMVRVVLDMPIPEWRKLLLRLDIEEKEE